MKRFSSTRSLVIAGALLTLAGAVTSASAAPFVQTAPGLYTLGGLNDVYAGARALKSYRGFGVQIIDATSCYLGFERGVKNNAGSIRYGDLVRAKAVNDQVGVKVASRTLQRDINFYAVGDPWPSTTAIYIAGDPWPFNSERAVRVELANGSTWLSGTSDRRMHDRLDQLRHDIGATWSDRAIASG